MAVGGRSSKFGRGQPQRREVIDTAAAIMEGRPATPVWSAEEVYVLGVPEPFVLDSDGCLDLSSMQFSDPKVMIVNGRRGLVDSDGRTKRPLAYLRDILGDQSVGTLQKPLKVAKGLPLQSYSLTEPSLLASLSRPASLLYPVYSLLERHEPSIGPSMPSASLPASRAPIQTPSIPAAPSVGPSQPQASAVQTNGTRVGMPLPQQLMPPLVPASAPPLDQLVHAASMEHPLLLQHMQQKQHIWKAAREERKQQLDAKNSSRSLLMLKNPPDSNKRQKVTNRGGAGVPAHCSTCGKPRKGTHAKTGCPTHCVKCKKVNAECECPDGASPSNASQEVADSDTASQGD